MEETTKPKLEHIYWHEPWLNRTPCKQHILTVEERDAREADLEEFLAQAQIVEDESPKVAYDFRRGWEYCLGRFVKGVRVAKS